MKKKTLLVYALPVFLLASCTEQKKTEPKPVDVVVAPVEEKEITPSGTIIGQVKADKSVNLVARVKGFLLEKNFKEGQMVKKGRLLFKIEPYEYQAQVKAAEAEELKAQAQLKNALIEYNRQKTLLRQNATSERKFDDATSVKMQSEAMLMNAQAKVAEAKLNLSYTSVYAPFDGRVGLVNYDVGNVVGPDSGTLANIVRMDLVRVMFNLSEVIMLNVFAKNKGVAKTSDQITVRVRFQNGLMYNQTGKISYWSNKINISTGTLKMEATFENPEDILIPGMYVHVIFEGKNKVKALLAPREAIIDDQSGKYVLLVNKQNLVEQRRIEAGKVYGADQQVTSGLKSGDLVIIGGLQKVRPDVKVKPVIDKNRANLTGASSQTITTAESKPAEGKAPETAKPAEVTKPIKPAKPTGSR